MILPKHLEREFSLVIVIHILLLGVDHCHTQNSFYLFYCP